MSLKFIIISNLFCSIIFCQTTNGISFRIKNKFLYKNKVNLLEVELINNNDYPVFIPLDKSTLKTNEYFNSIDTEIIVPKIQIRKKNKIRNNYISEFYVKGDTLISNFAYEYKNFVEKFNYDFYSKKINKDFEWIKNFVYLKNNFTYIESKTSQLFYYLINPSELEICANKTFGENCEKQFAKFDSNNDWTFELILDLENSILQSFYDIMVEKKIFNEKDKLFSGKLMSNKVILIN